MGRSKAEVEREYAELFLEYLELVQSEAPDTTAVHLVFAPIGKNILLLASELTCNVKLRRRTVIEPGAYGFDRRRMDRFNRAQGTSHRVLPWVLQRFGGHEGDPRPWEIWFKNFSGSPSGNGNFEQRAEELEDRLALLRPRVDSPNTLELGACVAYVTRLNPATGELVEPQRRVPGKGCVGVHIRRGDAADEEGRNADPARKFFGFDRYVEEMERYLERGYTSFYLLTESQQEVDRIRSHFEGRCEIYSQEVDRSGFPNLHDKKHGEANFIENLCLEDPRLIEFTVSTALVDLDNCSRCEAFIGTFSSAFSNLAYLGAVGHNRCSIEHTDLEGGDIGATLFHPSIAEKKGVSLFVLKERDVGFFSMFLQVVNALLMIRQRNLNCLPFVSLGDKQDYYEGENSWEVFIDKLVFFNEEALKKGLGEVESSFNARLEEKKYWDILGVVYVLASNLLWSSSYYPSQFVPGWLGVAGLRAKRTAKRLAGRLAGIVTREPKAAQKERLNAAVQQGLISHKGLPTPEQRREAAVLIGNFISLKPSIKAQVNELFGPYEDHYVVGVQFRGTDARQDARREVPDYEEYVEIIEQHLESRPAGDQRPLFIFAASDEDEFISFLSGRFPNVGSFNLVRHSQAEGDSKSDGRTGQSMPAFIRKDRTKALEGALLDYAGLCRSDFMIHNFGSLTNAALLTNPRMGNHLVGRVYVK